MISAATLRSLRGPQLALSVISALGYPVSPVAVDREEWARGGISIEFPATLHLILRLERFDLFLIMGEASRVAIHKFITDYAAYNVSIKSLLIQQSSDDELSLFDLSPEGRVRRLDLDIRRISPHALDRLNMLFWTGVEAELPRTIDLALDRGSVSRLFFQRFRQSVREVSRTLSALHLDVPVDVIESEALLLLSRLLFLAFVQEKGWLNGERRFLFDRLQRSLRDGSNFFATALLPLFFGCLNTDVRNRDAAALALGRIPYLNGGLFEPSAFERDHPGLALPNELLASIIEDLFERFDFRVDETDDAGMHVDPEMLGKVFESLMAEDERAASGSFYTPREIVDVLVRGAIEEWIADGDEILRRQLATPAMLPPTKAAELLERLASITVVDPACGSGAFLLSALTTLEELARRLGSIAGVELPPNLRQRIVERNLFGVDLKAEAVRLCELRLWLALVSSSECSIEDVEPLPNLDRNILQGNSLFTPTDFLGAGRADLYRDWLVAVRAQADLVERYKHAPHSQRPALARLIRLNDLTLAAEILTRAIAADSAELTRMAVPDVNLFGQAVRADAASLRRLQERMSGHEEALRRVESGNADFFSWDVHFASVMARGGFDVVNGNPPWVRNARIEPASKRMLADRYPLFGKVVGSGGFHQPDLAVAFFDRALSLSRDGGVVSFLLPAKIINAGYAAALRRFCVQETSIVAVVDFSDSSKSFDADVFPLGLTVAKRRPRPGFELNVVADGESHRVPGESLAVSHGEWALMPPDVSAILQRLERDHAPMAEVLGRRPMMGVKSGDNRLFFLDVTRVGDDCVETREGDRIPLSAVCCCLRGRELRRWSAQARQWMLWPPPNGYRVPPPWLERYAARRDVPASIFRLSFVKPEHSGVKVAWKDVSRGMAASVMEASIVLGGAVVPIVPNQTLYSIDAATIDEAHVIASMLNNSIADALLLATLERAKDSHYRYFGRTVAALPFPRLVRGSVAWEKLARASRRAHQGCADQTVIDQLAATIYGVDAGELSVLQRFVAKRLGVQP